MTIVDATVIATQLFEENPIVVIPVADIWVDAEYQRALSEDKVREIVSHFNPASLGVLIVNRRENGRYYCMDGQHRLASLKKLGIAQAKCDVFCGLSLAEESGVFIDSNYKTKKPGAIDLFRARLIRQDPIVAAVKETVEKCGLYIQFHPTSNHPTRKRPPTAIWAVQALETIYKRGGASLLEEVLLLAKQAWPGDGDAFQAKVILGIMDFHLKYKGRYLREDFIAKMHTKELKSLLRRAQYHSENGGGAFPKTFSKALQEYYDTGRRSRRLEKGNV